MSKKNLYILRHAKAEMGEPAQDDHDRGLSKRGMDAAAAIGNYITRQNIHFDKIICSSAKRTRLTLDGLQLQPLPDVEYNEKLYLATPNEILGVVASLDEAINSILMVGHNPGLHLLSLKLGVKGKESLLNKLAVKFPTGSFVAIEIEGEWEDIAQAQGVLLDFVTPKTLTP